MAKPLDCSHIYSAIESLLPDLILHDQDIIFLLNQIKKNISLLAQIPLEENSIAQYQMWRKTLEYIAAIREIILLRHQQIVAVEESMADESVNSTNATYLSELGSFIESDNIESLNALVKEMELNALQRFPVIHCKMLIIHHLSNFQTNRIFMLKIFYEEIDDILVNNVMHSDDKIKKIQQNCIDFYYRLRKSSMRFNIFLARASREASLADALEKFINEVILINSGNKIAHDVGKMDAPPDINDLLGS